MRLKLAICCTGMDISASSPFHSSTLMGRMTGPTAAKNEKRKIRMQCSDEFKPGGRPTSLLYDTFFESVIFDDVTALRSPFLAEIESSNELDRKIRINVYYTSNLSGGKETIIAATTFGLREFLRSGKGSFQSNMISEYCVSPKAYVVAATTPSDPFSSSFFSLSSSKEKNPLKQQYVFYRSDEFVPTVVCDEITYEPAFPVHVTLAYLKNFANGLRESILAWEDRCKLERLRQGKFVSVAEAHKYGWHQVRITVLSARIKCQGDLFKNTAASSRSLSVEERRDGDGESIHRAPPPPMDEAPSPPPARQSSTSSLGGSNRVASAADEMKSRVACNTFVEVFLEKDGNVFLQHVGRTNTEYASLDPKYGSSVGKIHVNKSQKGTEFLAFEATEIVAQSVWCVGVELGLDGFEGNVYHMMTYVPNLSTTQVRLDLFHEEDTSAKSVRMGSCWIPLGGNNHRDAWFPMSMVQSYAFSEAAVRVQIEVISSPHVSAIDPGFCSSMPLSSTPISEHEFYENNNSSSTGTVVIEALHGGIKDAGVRATPALHVGQSEDSSCEGGVWSKSLRSDDSDDEDVVSQLVDGKLFPAPSVHTFGSTNDLLSLNCPTVIRNCYRWMWDLGYTGCDPLIFSPGVGKEGSFDGKSNRVDIVYDLHWMASHVHGLKQMLNTVTSLIGKYENMVENGITIRKSPLKENMEMQCLPLNLHFQFMVSRRHITKSDLAEISDFTTCGAMSAHGLGYKNGGLGHQEDALGREKAAIESLVGQFYGQATNRSNLHPTSPAHTLYEKIRTRVQSFESDTLQVGLRRLFCTSQILSIAVNSLLLKLNLVALGYIDPFFADRWLDQGFPLIFESLLSVSGKEKVMLEDTARAIEVLRSYRIRIIGGKSRVPPSCGNSIDSPIIEVVKRDIVIRFSDEFLSRLPPRYYPEDKRESGVIISMESFLFTLGIDIKQAMATTWENADGNLDFQVAINKRGFSLLNEYCHKVMPIDQFAELLHPFVSDFEATLRNPSKMNVDILHEVEKISVMLGGCRVTFCKSGKDRTGMAVTLDQSRQLSEIYGLENNNDRVIKDANLMRIHGTRLMVAEKNIGRAVFAINRLQLQFMPALYRPPASVLEDVFKASDSS